MWEILECSTKGQLLTAPSSVDRAACLHLSYSFSQFSTTAWNGCSLLWALLTQTNSFLTYTDLFFKDSLFCKLPDNSCLPPSACNIQPLANNLGLSVSCLVKYITQWRNGLFLDCFCFGRRREEGFTLASDAVLAWHVYRQVNLLLIKNLHQT